jgi:cell division protein FtsI (penicillin-binding protein 3)
VIRPSRVGLVHGAFLLFAVALVCRAAQVQLVQTSEWRAKARHQQVAAAPVQAPRGMILDASGALLVESRQLVKLSVAPREVEGAGKRAGSADSRGLAALARALAHARVSSEWVARATDTSRAWVEVPGRFLAADVGDLMTWRGVHTAPVLERVGPAADGLRRLIGRADGAGEPLDGMEKSLDPVLRGESGRASLLRDSRGRRFGSPGVTRTEPRAGSTVTLTINQALQDIAERALGDAVRQTGATGGDIVMLDPLSGELRAMASRRADPLSISATALTEPYEPGSTLKPFVVARLLDLGRARVDEVVNTHDGKWELNGRKIEDDHPAPSFSLADVIRFSSNIGIVQFAQRFTPREQYELLRDVGFGASTGLPYPAEESGRLPSPARWDKQTPASLAMGYALNVTPLQLAVAYGAIANGGELLEPAIVREIRSSDGVLAYRHERRVVRRVMSDATARTVRGLLRGVVEGGTGESASLATFDVAGKTGTAKRTEHGRYVAGKYTASFVGLFPADHPQLVILVKLDNPSKSIYGAKTAAPVTKTVLQAAIAAREASLDRRDLAAVPSRAARAGAPLPDSVAHADSLVRIAESGSVPYVYMLDSPGRPAAGVAPARVVPDVRGLAVRRAVYALHRAGFRVTLAAGGVAVRSGGAAGDGAATGTVPSAGALVAGGSTIRLDRAP